MYKEIQVENITHTYDAVSTRNDNYRYVVLFIFVQIISAISFSKYLMELAYVKITVYRTTFKVSLN